VLVTAQQHMLLLLLLLLGVVLSRVPSRMVPH
jgi:hypothetical protein